MYQVVIDTNVLVAALRFDRIWTARYTQSCNKQGLAQW